MQSELRHLERIAGWGRVAWLCFPISTVSVNSICSPYFSGGRKRTKSSSSELYELLASRSFAELFTPLEKKSSLWLPDFADNPLCHQQAAKQLACTNNESCTLVNFVCFHPCEPMTGQNCCFCASPVCIADMSDTGHFALFHLVWFLRSFSQTPGLLRQSRLLSPSCPCPQPEISSSSFQCSSY